jgi:hypothetical protein
MGVAALGALGCARSQSGRESGLSKGNHPEVALISYNKMAAVVSRGVCFECFWDITEPEIATQFEGRDFAFF